MKRQHSHGLPRSAWFAVILALAPLVACGGVPVMHSDHGAQQVIYLDFNGHSEPKSRFTCPPPSGATEGWPIAWTTSDISKTIRADVARAIWQAVAEDFAPFNVDVTTDPAYDTFAGAANTVRIAIGDASIEGTALGYAPAVCEEDQLANPAYLNPRIVNTAAVKYTPTQSITARDLASRISHEAGHIYGLLHHVKPKGLLDGWIMAPAYPANRKIWLAANNEFGQFQDDIAQLTWLLGRRSDATRAVPMHFSADRPAISGPAAKGGFLAHGTHETLNDIDDFLFTVPAAGQLDFQIYSGIWTNVYTPVFGSEANLRYAVQVLTDNGRTIMACPASPAFSLEATTQNVAAPWNCQSQIGKLRVGQTYRIRVTRVTADSEPGNLGRYTVVVKHTGTAKPTPPLGGIAPNTLTFR